MENIFNSCNCIHPEVNCFSGLCKHCGGIRNNNTYLKPTIIENTKIPTAKGFFESISNPENEYGMIGALKAIAIYKSVLDIMDRYAKSKVESSLEALREELKENVKIKKYTNGMIEIDKSSIDKTIDNHLKNL